MLPSWKEHERSQKHEQEVSLLRMQQTVQKLPATC